MAWTNFQKSNWTRVVGPQHMVQYFPASVQGTVTGNITFTAGQTKTLTLTAAFNFKGNGLIDAWGPEGSSSWGTAAAAGLNLGAAWLTGPASGSYAAGNHPLILIQLQASSAYTTAATGFDLICQQS